MGAKTGDSHSSWFVLLVEDDLGFADLLASELRSALSGVDIQRAVNIDDALRLLEGHRFDALVLDRALPDGDGLELVRQLRATGRGIPFVILTADGSARGAIASFREGCCDYIVKGEGSLANLRHTLGALLRAGVSEGALVGASAAMRRVRAEIQLYAPSDAPVLIEGETGVGKELVARALHDEGSRAAGPFVPVNCGALPEQLVESELFGHVRGAFTGAVRDHPGLVELASRGTLFLDEIEDLPLSLQGKLLRLLQEREYRPVGGARQRRADIRVVAAGNADLHRMVEEKRFRRDLFFRLNVLRIAVPPLRERTEDLLGLIAHLAVRAGGSGALQPYVPPTPAQVGELARHPWPGNVRELANLVEYAAIHAASAGWRVGWAAALARLASDPPRAPAVSESDRPALLPDGGDAEERRALEDLLARHRWRREEAARELGISRVTLWRRMRRLGIAG